MRILRILWKTVSETGLPDEQHSRILRKVKLTNQITFVACFMTFIQMLAFSSQIPRLPILMISCIVAYSLTWIFNQARWWNFSRIYFSIVSCAGILVTGSLFTEDTNFGFKLMLIQAFTLPLVVFDIKEWRLMLMSIAFYAVSFVMFDTINSMIPVMEGTVKELYNSPEYISVNGVLCMVTLFIGYRYMQKLNFKAETKLESSLKITKAQKEEILSKNQDIEDGIAYAKRIQQAILPKQEEISTSIPEHFVYYAPKETIGGDFFWYGEYEQHIVLACVDCTGHGTPGALISIIGSKLLDKIVKDWGVSDPAEILELVNLEMICTLQSDYSEIKDGMDMTIISIDCHQKEVRFAGAKNSLVIANNDNITRLKGDRASIGETHIFKDGFKSQVVEFGDKDTLYMFSDGIIDQFGGPQNKKFMNRRFFDILKRHGNEDLSLQKGEIEKRFLDWMGANEQIDDVLIIGFRLDMEYMHKMKRHIPIVDINDSDQAGSIAS